LAIAATENRKKEIGKSVKKESTNRTYSNLATTATEKQKRKIDKRSALRLLHECAIA
jgi:hypothetical protein